MLYFKIDANGNPLSTPQTEAEIKAELLNQGTIAPSNLQGWLVENRYVELPVDEPMPMAPLGQKTVPDIPVKNADGTYSRRWKFVDAVVLNQEAQARVNRATYLNKFADSISPLRWESWSEAQKEEVRQWYQAILDLPNDPQWPNVAMPELPTPIKG